MRGLNYGAALLVLLLVAPGTLPLVEEPPPDCPECVVRAVLLHDNTQNGRLVQTGIVLHPGDDPVEVAREACTATESKQVDCVGAVMAEIASRDYMARFHSAASGPTRVSPTSMSRHEKLTIVKRLRAFERPRRLLVIGAGPEAAFWHEMNGRSEGGFTCFIERALPPRDPQQFATTPATPNVAADMDMLKAERSMAGVPFIKVAYDVESALAPGREWSPLDHAEMSREIPSNFSILPWDVVVLYDICREESAPDGHQRCVQTYFEYAAERTIDDGYFFVQASTATAAEGGEKEVDERRATEKFAGRFEVNAHIGSQVPLRYFTSLERAPPRPLQSASRAATAALTSCIEEEYHRSWAAAAGRGSLDEPLPSLRHRAVAALTARGYSRVVGVLFCCRKRYTSVLLGYLQRNLRIHGGLLDHIVLFQYGTINDDASFPSWLATQPGFVARTECGVNTTFGCAYATLGHVDPNALFVKLDDDLLFLSDGAIEALVLTRCGVDGPAFVHGNGVNHLHTPFFHALAARDATRQHCTADASGTNGGGGGGSGACVADNTVRIGSGNWTFYGRDWQRPAKAQEQHSVFLARMTRHLPAAPRDAERPYLFGDVELSRCRCAAPQPGTGVCSAKGHFRTSINLVCFAWSDVADHLDLLQLNDEIAMTVYIPERGGHRSFVSGRALYVHAAFTPQRESDQWIGQLDEPRVLEGYAAVAAAYLSVPPPTG